MSAQVAPKRGTSIKQRLRQPDDPSPGTGARPLAARAAFPGLHTQRQALEYGVKIVGCTVHLVDEGLDTGPILAQRAVPVLDGDTEVTLSARILAQEHRLYIGR